MVHTDSWRYVLSLVSVRWDRVASAAARSAMYDYEVWMSSSTSCLDVYALICLEL